MSKQYPVIVVTGSSGAGTTSVKCAFEHIFTRLKIKAAIVEGDSFHRYEREEMVKQVHGHDEKGLPFSHFSAEANLLKELETLFRQYGETGTGSYRRYIHNEEEAKLHGYRSGTFTPWQPYPDDTDLMFYEGLHGAATAEDINIGRYVDMTIGAVPVINLEWIQKLHRDTQERGYRRDTVTDTILRRMYDYVHMITPQFSRTDINFQRVPTVDTSNPFIARDVPTPDESFVIIRVNDPRKFDVDFPYLLAMIHNSFMSRRNNLVIPGGKMGLAMEIIFTPIIEKIMTAKKQIYRLGE
ncbi:MAG: phosphoribulokinase [Methylococcales bacterium]